MYAVQPGVGDRGKALGREENIQDECLFFDRDQMARCRDNCDQTRAAPHFKEKHGFSRLFHGVVTAFQFPARVITAVQPSFHGFTGANERKGSRTS